MRKLIYSTLFTCFAISANALSPGLTVDDNEFKVDKQIVAKVKTAKVEGFGKELSLLDANDAVLLVLPVKTITIGNPPRYINYASIYVPILKDTIEIFIDSLQADGVKIGLTSPNDDAWADYLFRKNIVNADGTLNVENVKALKARYPLPAPTDYSQKQAAAAACAKQINTPTNRNSNTSVIVTEVNRQTSGATAVIKYKVEFDGAVLGEIIAKGPAVNLANERAEVDFKTKVFYKKSDMENQPMGFDIYNSNGCKVATYSPMSKVLATVRADKGGTHGIMKPILDGKTESVKTRLEVVTAMVDYLVKLGYY